MAKLLLSQSSVQHGDPSCRFLAGHRARCREPSAQVLQAASPKHSGNASPDRSGGALEKVSSCERHPELNHRSSRFLEKQTSPHAAIRLRAGLQSRAPGEVPSSPCPAPSSQTPCQDRAQPAPCARLREEDEAHSFLEYLITPGFLLTPFIASGSLCF